MSLRGELHPPSLTGAVLAMEHSCTLRLSQEVDRMELLAVVDQLITVGIAYKHFEQLHDQQVLDFLTTPANEAQLRLSRLVCSAGYVSTCC